MPNIAEFQELTLDTIFAVKLQNKSAIISINIKKKKK